MLLSRKTKQLVLSLFDQIAHNEIKVEHERQKINSFVLNSSSNSIHRIFNEYMSPDPYDQVDKFVNARDILDFMSQFLKQEDACKIQESDFSQIFQHFDFNNDGFLDVDDFIAFTCSQDDIDLRSRYEEKCEQDRQQLISMNTYCQQDALNSICTYIAKLFYYEVRYYMKLNKGVKILESQHDYNSVACFCAMDPYKRNFIGVEELQWFKSSNQGRTLYSDDELKAIFRRTNANFDFKLTFQEFSSNVVNRQSYGYWDDITCQTKDSREFVISSPNQEKIIVQTFGTNNQNNEPPPIQPSHYVSVHQLSQTKNQDIRRRSALSNESADRHIIESLQDMGRISNFECMKRLHSCSPESRSINSGSICYNYQIKEDTPGGRKSHQKPKCATAFTDRVNLQNMSFDQTRPNRHNHNKSVNLSKNRACSIMSSPSISDINNVDSENIRQLQKEILASFNRTTEKITNLQNYSFRNIVKIIIKLEKTLYKQKQILKQTGGLDATFVQLCRKNDGIITPVELNRKFGLAESFCERLQKEQKITYEDWMRSWGKSCLDQQIKNFGEFWHQGINLAVKIEQIVENLRIQLSIANDSNVVSQKFFEIMRYNKDVNQNHSISLKCLQNYISEFAPNLDAKLLYQRIQGHKKSEHGIPYSAFIDAFTPKQKNPSSSLLKNEMF